MVVIYGTVFILEFNERKVKFTKLNRKATRFSYVDIGFFKK